MSLQARNHRFHAILKFIRIKMQTSTCAYTVKYRQMREYNMQLYSYTPPLANTKLLKSIKTE